MVTGKYFHWDNTVVWVCFLTINYLVCTDAPSLIIYFSRLFKKLQNDSLKYHNAARDVKYQ